MPAVRRQANIDDWITVDQAADLTGLSVRHWRRLAERAFHRSLARKAGPPVGKGKQVWYVHRSLHARLTRYPKPKTREDRTREALLARFPAHTVDNAYRKARWLRQWRKAIDQTRLTEREAAEQIIEQAGQEGFKVSFRSLQAWHRAYHKTGPDRQIIGVEGLIDGRSVAKSAAGIAAAPRGRNPDAIDYFYGLFHTENKLSAKLCHEHTATEATAQGWAWPASYSATRKWLAAYDDVSLSFLLRYGSDDWNRRYRPHNEIDYSLIEPGQFFQTDHHQADFWVEHEGEQLRPWLTVVQDMRSRAIVGWNVGPKPHTDAILAAYLMAFRDWAIPERLRIDNGKDYASELLTGVTKATRDSLRRQYGRDWKEVLRRDAELIECVDPRFLGITEELGIDAIYAIPYAPWSKGTTERFFGTFESRCGKTFASYCGNSPDNRPECLEAIRKAGELPTMEEARTAIAEYLIDYHNTPHSSLEGCTPLEVWNTAQRLRRAGETELLFLMQSRGVYKVTANGVAFKAFGGRMTYGKGNPALYRYIGREVFVAVDPDQPAYCFAFTDDRKRFIGRLESNERISPMATSDDLRAAQARIQRRNKRQRQAQRESPARTQSLARELAAKRKQRAAELRATGTDDRRPTADIVPVRTGFEDAVKTVRSAGPSVDRKARDLSAAKAALGFGRGLAPRPKPRPRVSDDLLRGGPIQETEAVKDDGRDGDGKEAGKTSSTELLRLIGGTRHERPNE